MWTLRKLKKNDTTEACACDPSERRAPTGALLRPRLRRETVSALRIVPGASSAPARRGRRSRPPPRPRAPPRASACPRRPPRAAPDRAGCCRAAAPRSRRRARCAAARRRRSPARCPTRYDMFSTTPTIRMPTFSAIAAARTATCWAAGCGVVTIDDLGPRQQLAERDRDVAGAGRHVDDERVELAPVDVREELLERAVQHRAAPHHRARCRRGRTRSTSASGRRAPAARSSCRRRPGRWLDAEHVRDRVAVDVGVEHADPLAPGGERRGEVRGQRRLADAALAGGDREHARAAAPARSIFSGRPPRRRDDSAAFSSGLITSKWSSTGADPLDGADEPLHLILERGAHAGSRRR